MKRKERTANVYGVEGKGSTRAAAIADASVTVERLVAQGSVPRVVAVAKYPVWALVFRVDARYWGYGIFTDKPEKQSWQGGIAWKVHATSSWYDSPDEAVEHARSHLAQYVLRPLDDNNTGLEFLVDHPKAYDEHKRYIAWQRSYAEHRAQGHDDVTAHAEAWSDMRLVDGLDVVEEGGVE